MALAWVFSSVNWAEVSEAINEADYRYLVPVIVLYTLGLATRGVAWRLLLRGESTYTKVFLTINIGYLLNNILPLRLGELGRALLLGRHGLGFWRVLTTIIVERAFDMIVIAGMLLGTLPFMFGIYRSYQYIFFIFSIVLIGFIALYLLVNNQRIVYKSLEKMGTYLPKLSLLIEARIQAFFMGLTVLTKPLDLIFVFYWMMMTWFFALSAQFLLLKAFLPQVNLIWIVFGQGLVALGAAAPSSPAYIGVIEAAWVGALTMFGVRSGTALAYALASHLLNIVVTGLIGGYALVKEGESISDLYGQLRKKIPSKSCN